MKIYCCWLVLKILKNREQQSTDDLKIFFLILIDLGILGITVT